MISPPEARREKQKYMFDTILPTNFIASTTEILGDFMSGLSPYLFLIIGVLIGAVVIEIIIGAIRGR